MKYERGSAEEETATRANGATMIEVVSRYLAQTIIVAGCPGSLLHSMRSLVRPRRFRFASVLRHRRLRLAFLKSERMAFTRRSPP